MTKPRDSTFPMRFKRPQTKEALKRLAAAQGTSMTEVAERAIEHEVALLGADMERRLTEALEVVRTYNQAGQGDVEDWIDAVAVGEESGLDPMRDVANTAGVAARTQDESTLDDPFGVLAAFARR
ncbi:hypothetical protein NSZ01_39050 [Nocardioides szechwanensis]|uniref:Ribbon-helix-helix protein, copG family n=1 Tax=Nocardioides szechwanensis TaxID=1005944 RepID=A0A1H0BLK4_9ACTN|nr:ribbon-helix-helix protein, CopG family [Nocardioides szechwanensis]GEP36137.1 hypothetical protein NSZ01_39050 [Nocardioides szechwanensis]SDN46546.1 Ribbon-helix-helix protein, copG family [Nocardioides szechwanensis]